MRNTILSVLSILILFLTACTNYPKDTKKHFMREHVQIENNEENPKLKDGQGESKASDQCSNKPEYKLDENWNVTPIDETADEQVVLLTIDDTPDEYALEMAETLVDLDASAIFFVNGHLLETDKQKKILKEIHNMGFIIGNHTYSHYNLSELKEHEQTEEIVQVNDMIEQIIGERPKFFRPPHGVYTDHVKKVVEDEEMTMMNWTYGYDWEEEYQTKEALLDVMVNTEMLGPGSNLLMHDREWTAKALRDIVISLREKNYEIVDPCLIELDY